MTIGTAAVGLLSPYLVEIGMGAAKKAGEQGLQKVESLFAAVRGKLGQLRSPHGQLALERLEIKPSDPRRQRALADILDELAEEDPSFRQQLEHLTRTAREDQRVVQILNISGNAHVGNVSTFGHVDGDVHIGEPGTHSPLR